MRALYIRLPDDLLPKLREIARRELRTPNDQASVLLIEAIEKEPRRLVADKADAAEERVK